MRTMAALLLAFSITAAWTGETLTPEAYQQRLMGIESALADGDFTQATALSDTVASLTVTWPQGPLHGDPTIAALIHHSALAAARLRVHADILALASATGSTAMSGDAASLARIARRDGESAWQLRSGGDIAGIPTRVRMPTTWQDRVLDALTWIHDAVSELLHWLRSLLPGARSADGHDGSGSLVQPISLILVGIILILALVMAWRTWWTAPTPVQQSGSPVARSGIDADPRSRAVDEWQAYAQRLAAEGRYREATRAWYHALLVQCWSNGLIHHRVGKTNWEYALLLPMGLAWRDRFRGLTLQYDQIWYGHRDDAEAVESFSRDAMEILAMVRRGSA